MKSVPTLYLRISFLQASPILFRGSRVTYSTSSPSIASDTATLASLPPNSPSHSLPCVMRCLSGRVMRSMISPKVTILFLVISIVYV